MTKREFKLGCPLPDPFDKRDRPSSALLSLSGPVPQRSDNRHLIPNIIDQGQLSSCVANACIQAARASQILQGAVNPPLGSRLFAYYFARKHHGGEKEDAGTYGRSCLSGMAKLGFPLESAWRYDPKMVNIQPPFEAVHGANDQKAKIEYARIFETGSARVDVVKRALAAGHLVTFGTDIDREFFDVRDDRVLGVPGTSIGGHMMCFRDHEDDNFWVANSWEPDVWGASGYCRISADWVADQVVRDLSIVRNVPLFSKTS